MKNNGWIDKPKKPVRKSEKVNICNHGMVIPLYKEDKPTCFLCLKEVIDRK